MANLKTVKPSADIIIGLIGIFFIASGISGINDAVAGRIHNLWISNSLVIFGSMLLGVAINRISNGVRIMKSDETIKKAKK